MLNLWLPGGWAIFSNPILCPFLVRWLGLIVGAWWVHSVCGVGWDEGVCARSPPPPTLLPCQASAPSTQ